MWEEAQQPLRKEGDAVAQRSRSQNTKIQKQRMRARLPGRARQTTGEV